MKSLRVQHLMAIALAWGFCFTSTHLFAQQVAPGARVPVGRPVPPSYEYSFSPTPPLPRVHAPRRRHGGVSIDQSYEGIDFLDSNCGCLPPDTNAAVNGNYIVETVNLQIRFFDKVTGNVLLDEPLSTFFGQSAGSDPYVVYDDIAARWYVIAIDSNFTGVLLTVSNDSNPLDGFLPTYHLANLGSPDYPKLGYNQDAIFVSYNDFSKTNADATIASIDKAAALSGTLTFYVSVPEYQFRAMPPAQMHGDNQGGVEWFASTDGTDSGGNSIRVTKMTNYLSNAPQFVYTSLRVNQYSQASQADQPNGIGTVTVFPNTTTTQVHFRNGHLVTAMASGTASDGFIYPKGLSYRINVNSSTPTLLAQGVINPGQGIAVQMVSVDEDNRGHLGLTWMESSSTEYVSMWVGQPRIIDPSGRVNPPPSASVAAPGGGFMTDSFRIGDYSTIVLDPSDDTTFWAANEYIGSDGDSDIWRTHLTSFTGVP